jgi:predicted O-methyltransferase YrrM
MFWATGHAGLRDPVGLVKHLLAQGEVFDTGGTSGVQGLARAALDESLQAFMSDPPVRLLPSQDLVEICRPTALDEDAAVVSGDASELPEIECQVVRRIVSGLKPSTVFEIGTYRGRTTRLLAQCSPSATVHTLDLPPERMVEGGCFQRPDPGLIGAHFARDRALLERIVQHYGDSRAFDFSPFRGAMDVVFVDASHAYEAVLNDSARAFELLRQGGAILWDDYHPIHGPGVMRALSDIVQERPLVWIKGTRLAYYRAPAC